jgi:hypothetical protein
MALVNFIRQGSTSVAQTINFSVGGSATFNTDYTIVFPSGITGTWTSTTGSVIIPIGSSQVDVSLNITGDSIVETDETVLITITSVSPVVGISSTNSAAVLIIQNDDFTVNIRVIGVTLDGTQLVGTRVGGPTSWTASNAGSAPANWTNWLTGSNSSGGFEFVFAGATSNPQVAKFAVGTPTAAPVNTTTEYLMFNFGAPGFGVSLRGNSSGNWDYLLYWNNALVGSFLNKLPNTWNDFIFSYDGVTWVVYLDGVSSLSLGSSGGATSIVTRFYGSSRFAALSLSSSLAYSPGMFPITPANL